MCLVCLTPLRIPVYGKTTMNVNTRTLCPTLGGSMSTVATRDVKGSNRILTHVERSFFINTWDKTIGIWKRKRHFNYTLIPKSFIKAAESQIQGHVFCSWRYVSKETFGEKCWSDQQMRLFVRFNTVYIQVLYPGCLHGNSHHSRSILSGKWFQK